LPNKTGYSYGSGIIIGKSNSKKLLVLTNYHVTKDFYSKLASQPPCFIHSEIATYHFATPVEFTSIATQSTMEAEDWSFLEVGDPVPSSDNISINQTQITDQYTAFPRICLQNDLTAGAEFVVLGYPSIGGGSLINGSPVLSLTATEGIISTAPENWQHYFVGTAKIDEGNSGGGAFLKSNGCLAGIPTFAEIGKVESLGRFINLANFKVKYSALINGIQN